MQLFDRAGLAVIEDVKRERLTYLDREALLDLYLAVRSVEDRSMVGMIIEAGCALGGSSLVMATAKAADRRMQVYDTFETIPPPGPADGADVVARFEAIATGQAEGIGGDPYYGYQGDLLPRVTESFDAFGLDAAANSIELRKGLFEDRLHPDGPVVLAHIDCDWYDSVKVCIDRILPHLVPGGRLIFDDFDHWSGSRRAVEDCFRDRDGFHFERRSRLHVIRDLAEDGSSSER